MALGTTAAPTSPGGGILPRKPKSSCFSGQRGSEKFLHQTGPKRPRAQHLLLIHHLAGAQLPLTPHGRGFKCSYGIPSEGQKFQGEPQADRETHPLETSWPLPLFSRLILTNPPPALPGQRMRSLMTSQLVGSRGKAERGNRALREMRLHQHTRQLFPGPDPAIPIYPILNSMWTLCG